MSVTASAVIASTLIVSDGADATVKSEKNVEAPWTVTIKLTQKDKNMNTSKVLKNRIVKKDSEVEDDSYARASRIACASGTYTVESGDTISEIAYSFGISTEQLMAWNNLDSTIIMPGQEVTLEEAASDTLYADNSNEVEEEVAEEVEEVTEPEESLEIVEVEEPQVETSTPDNEVAVASAEPAPTEEEPEAEEPVAEEEVVEEPAVEEEDQTEEGIAVAMAVAEDEPEEEVTEEEVVEETEESVEEEETSSTPEVATMSVSASDQAEEDQAEGERQEQAEKDKQAEAEKQAQAEKDKQAEAERQAQAENDKQAEAERQAEAEKDKQAKAERQAEAEEERQAQAEKDKQAEAETQAQAERDKQAEAEGEAQAEAERQAQAEKDKQAEAEKQKEPEPAPQPSGDLISNAKSVMGTPYVWGGTSTSGFDCSGFIYWAHKQSGNDIGRTSTDGYYNTSYIVNNPQPGDLVFFEGTYRSGISHIGIYLGGGQFIHAGSSTGVAIASVHSGYWGDHFHSYKRFY